MSSSHWPHASQTAKIFFLNTEGACSIPASAGGGVEVLLHLVHHLCFMLPEFLIWDLINEMSANRTDQDDKCIICVLCCLNFSFVTSLTKCLQTEQIKTINVLYVIYAP